MFRLYYSHFQVYPTQI